MNETVCRKVNIAGTGISDVSLKETMELFSTWIRQGEKKRICVTPVNCVVWAYRSPQLQQIYNDADLTLCDGVPLLWAARFTGARLKGRVTGLDLLPAFSELAARNGFRMFLLGAKPGVGDYLAAELRQRYPGIQICGTYAPPMMATFTREENEKMIRLVNDAAPDVVWVSFTAPKQDFWIYEHFNRLEAKIIIGVGGSFEVTAGLIDRAPIWMRKAGTEWLYRLIKEPKRLWRRYLLEAPQIIPMLWKQRMGRL